MLYYQIQTLFLWIAVTLNGIKTYLPNGLSTFPMKDNTGFSNGLPDCPFSRNLVFDNFILAEELFTKALQSFETCVLVNNKLCRKLFSSLKSSLTFDEIFKATSVFFLVQILLY